MGGGGVFRRKLNPYFFCLPIFLAGLRNPLFNTCLCIAAPALALTVLVCYYVIGLPVLLLAYGEVYYCFYEGK